MISKELSKTSQNCCCQMSSCVCSTDDAEQKGEPFYCSTAMTKEVYIRFLESLYLIYGAMEEELRKNVGRYSYPLETILFEKELFRRDALERDLTLYAGPRWKDDLVSTRATDAYVARIRQVGQEDPDALLAHHSTRYIGDLIASSSMREKTRRCFDLDPASDEGVAFYDFPFVQYPEKFKREYFEAVDELLADEVVRSKVSKEAKLVYQLNLNLYWELRGFMVSGNEDHLCCLDEKYGSMFNARSSNGENNGAFDDDDDDEFMGKNESKESDEDYLTGDSTSILKSCPPNAPEPGMSSITQRKSVRIETDNVSVNLDQVRKKKRRSKCSGLPMFAYSLLFWIVIWIVGSMLIYAWMHKDELKNTVINFK